MEKDGQKMVDYEITIDDATYYKLEVIAARRGCTLEVLCQEYIESAVERYLQEKNK